MVNNSTNINIVLFCFVYRNTIFTSIYFIIVTSRKMFWIILIFLTRNTPPTPARFLVWFMLLDLYFFVNCFVDHCLSFCPYFTWSLYRLSFCPYFTWSLYRLSFCPYFTWSLYRLSFCPYFTWSLYRLSFCPYFTWSLYRLSFLDLLLLFILTFIYFEFCNEATYPEVEIMRSTAHIYVKCQWLQDQHRVPKSEEIFKKCN